MVVISSLIARPVQKPVAVIFKVTCDKVATTIHFCIGKHLASSHISP